MIPVCVDLDGTLISNDVTRDAFFSSINISSLIHLVFDRPLFKKNLNYDRVSFCFVLPVIEHLLSLKNPLYLATGAHILIAQRVCEEVHKQYGLIFQGILATETVNLVGKAKADALTHLFDEFVYYGNSDQDIVVWDKAHSIGVVHPSPKAKKYVEQHPDKIVFKLY